MADILEYLGTRILGKKPRSTKRERKKKTVNIRNLWENADETLKDNETYAGMSMQELVPEAAEDNLAGQSQAAEAANQGSDASLDKAEDMAKELTTVEDDSAEEEQLLADIPEESQEEEEDLVADDQLLGKIDEFRESAKRLRKLMKDRENKVNELQTLVEQRENEAAELDQILAERKDAAEGVTNEVAKRLDVIADRITEHVDHAEVSTHEDISASSQQLLTEIRSVQDRVTGIGNTTVNVSNDTQNVQRKVNEITDKVSGIEESMGTVTENVGQAVTVINGLDGRFAEINEQIHSEGVKSYRNTADALKGMDDKLDQMNQIWDEVMGIRKFAVAAMVFALLDFIGMIGVAAVVVLHYLGII